METTSDCGRPFKARVGYFLWKNEFIKTKIKLRQEAMYLVWTSVCVLHKVDYIIKAWQKIIKARSFTTHFKEEEIKRLHVGRNSAVQATNRRKGRGTDECSVWRKHINLEESSRVRVICSGAWKWHVSIFTQFLVLTTVICILTVRDTWMKNYSLV